MCQLLNLFLQNGYMSMNEELNNEKKQAVALGTNVEKLFLWLADNPMDGYTCEETQLSLVSLLWSIHAPHDLRQFQTLIEILPEVYETLLYISTDGQLAEFRKSGFYCEYVRDLANHLKIYEREIVGLIGPHIKSISSRHDISPMRGSLSQYYAYAGLMTGLAWNGNDDDERKLVQLKAAVLLCHIKAMGIKFSPQKYLAQKSGKKISPKKG